MLSPWTRERVLDAAAEMEWLPVGAIELRAVLAERLRLARDHGATLALVKGRVLTSGPILLRAGFADYGEERCYWLPVS